MTELFFASKKWSTDLDTDLGASSPFETGHKAQGYVYMGCMMIEKIDHADGMYSLVLGNVEHVTDNLPELEQKLFVWAASEGYFE
jgi:hypothetical protein